jgi:hypothetical protein
MSLAESRRVAPSHAESHRVTPNHAGLKEVSVLFLNVSILTLFAVPPDIIDEESSSDTLATEGMRVGLVCKARGNPRTQIAWRREDGKPIRLCGPPGNPDNSDNDKIKSRKRGRLSGSSSARSQTSKSKKDCREGE